MQVETADHPIADSFEVVEVAEASGKASCSLNDTVDELDGSGGDAVGIVGEDAVPMSFECLHQLLEVCKPAEHGPGSPFSEVKLRPHCNRPLPSALEALA